MFSKCQDPSEISLKQITCVPPETASAKSSSHHGHLRLAGGAFTAILSPRAGDKKGRQSEGEDPESVCKMQARPSLLPGIHSFLSSLNVVSITPKCLQGRDGSHT